MIQNPGTSLSSSSSSSGMMCEEVLHYENAGTITLYGVPTGTSFAVALENPIRPGVAKLEFCYSSTSITQPVTLSKDAGILYVWRPGGSSSMPFITMLLPPYGCSDSFGNTVVEFVSTGLVGQSSVTYLYSSAYSTLQRPIYNSGSGITDTIDTLYLYGFSTNGVECTLTRFYFNIRAWYKN